MDFRVLPLCGVFVLLLAVPCISAEDAGFVGSKVCSQCHEKEYGTFKKYSKKAHSWESVAIMRPKLKERELKQCFECHTTGYGRKGGFVSVEATPDLAEVGCETCHGPGERHAASGDPKDITRRPSTQGCTACHNKERVEDFRFKPLIYSGAH